MGYDELVRLPTLIASSTTTVVANVPIVDLSVFRYLDLDESVIDALSYSGPPDEDAGAASEVAARHAGAAAIAVFEDVLASHTGEDIALHFQDVAQAKRMSSDLEERLDAALQRAIRILKRKTGTQAEARRVCGEFAAWARGRAQGDGELILCTIRGPNADFSRGSGSHRVQNNDKGILLRSQHHESGWEGASEKVNTEMKRIRDGRLSSTTGPLLEGINTLYPPVELPKGFLDAAEDGVAGASFAMRFSYSYKKGPADKKVVERKETKEEDRVFQKDLHEGRRLKSVAWNEHKIKSVTNSSFSGRLTWKVIIQSDLARAKRELQSDEPPLLTDIDSVAQAKASAARGNRHQKPSFDRRRLKSGGKRKTGSTNRKQGASAAAIIAAEQRSIEEEKAILRRRRLSFAKRVRACAIRKPSKLPCMSLSF